MGKAIYVWLRFRIIGARRFTLIDFTIQNDGGITFAAFAAFAGTSKRIKTDYFINDY